MRQITEKAIQAFLKSKSLQSGNTTVAVNENSPCGTLTQLFLFGNLIAEQSDNGLSITNAGWQSNTTKERLNALPGVNIYQQKGVWYLNGKEWNGEWIKIN